MAIDFRELTVDVTGSYQGPATALVGQPETRSFNGRVLRAEVVLKGFSIQFLRLDRSIKYIAVTSRVRSIEANSVTVELLCGLGDANQTFDEEWRGHLHALIIAEVQ